MTFFASALVMGFFSSGHCLGMCGPLVLALPVGESGYRTAVTSRILYNLGRIFTYASLGAIAGLVGAALALRALQSQIAWIAGSLLILVAVLQLLPNMRINLLSRMHLWLRESIAPLLRTAGPRRFIALGALNGLLPCGMVAAALVVSMAAATVAESIAYMAVFGLGTFPMMLAASLMGFYLAPHTRRLISIAAPFYSFSLGVLLILRPGLIAPHCG